MIHPVYYLFLLAPVLRAKYDYHVIEVKNQGVVYKASNTLSLLAMALSTVIIYVVTGDPILNIIFVNFTTHWLVFDYLLNHYRDEPILSYYGDFSDKENLSFIEEHVYQRASWVSLLTTKVCLFVLSILIYRL